MCLNGVADITEMCSRFDDLNAQVQAFVTYLGQALCQNARFTNQESFAGIAVIAILDKRHVNVNDIAILQDLVIAGNTVANHVID